jgi:hypothetical protein
LPQVESTHDYTAVAERAVVIGAWDTQLRLIGACTFVLPHNVITSAISSLDGRFSRRNVYEGDVAKVKLSNTAILNQKMFDTSLRCVSTPTRWNSAVMALGEMVT